MIFNVTEDKTEIISDIDEVRDYLLGKYPLPIKINKGIVADYCLRNGYPKNYVGMVFDAIKVAYISS
jgi:hypothetical protein